MNSVVVVGARLRGSRATAAAAVVTLSSLVACALAGCSRETFTGLDLDLQVGTRMTQVRLVSVTVDANDVPLPDAARVFPAVEGRDLRSGDVFTLRFADADAGKLVRVSAAGLVGGVQSTEIVTTEARALQSRSVVSVSLSLGYGDAGAPGSGGSPGTAGSGGRSTGSGGAAGVGGGFAGASGIGGEVGIGAGGTGAGGSGGPGGMGAGTGGRAGAGGGPGAGGAPGMGGRGTGGSGTGGSGTGGSGGAAAPSAGCGNPPGIPSSMYNNGSHITITAGGLDREYILNVPPSYDNTHPYRLIFAFHEINGNDDEMYRNKYYHLLPLSNDSAIFVAPNGQKSGANCATASQCGWPDSNNTDQLFIDALVAQIEQSFCVDTNRIFLTGWSYGAGMTYKAACQRPLGGVANGYVRAVAVYAGSQLSGACTPSKPVAYYGSHGTQDSVILYSSGVTLAQSFAAPNGCTWMAPTMVTSGNHVCTDMSGCKAGYPLEFCSFAAGDTPDPMDPGQTTSWQYQNVWNFLSQF